MAAATSSGGLRSTNVVHRCGRATPLLSGAAHLGPSWRIHTLGITLWTPTFRTRAPRCGYLGDNSCMTALQMGVTTGFNYPVCGLRGAVHSMGELCTGDIHPSYTGPWAGHLRQRGLCTESTGPTTTMRPITMDPAPSTWGKSGSRSTRAGQPPGTTGQVLVEGPGGIRVSAHLCMRLSSPMCVEGRVYR